MGGSSKGGKKQTVGYFYSKDLHGVICHAPVDAITRIECDDREILREEIKESKNVYLNNRNLFGGDDREGGIQGNIDVLFGEDDQQQNPYLLEKIGEYLPSYRGVLSVVFKNLYLGMNPYLRTFKYRVRKTSVGWYDAKSQINREEILIPAQTVWKYNLFSYGDNTNRVNEDKSSWSSGKTPFGDKYFSAPAAYNFPVNPSTVIPQQVTLWAETNVLLGDINGDFFFDCFLDNGITVWINGVQVVNNYNRNAHYYSQNISKSYFTENSSNRITIKCVDDGEGVRPSNWIWFDLRLQNFNMNYDSDINPAHVIYDLLTNKRYGKGVSPSKVDLVALKKMADTLYDEKMGLSLIWAESTTFESFMNNVCDHIKAVVPYVDASTGLWTTKLLRDDYSKPALVHLNESNIKKISDFNRRTMTDAVNIVTVTYWDRRQGKDATISVDNPARVAQQGRQIQKEINYDGFTNSEIAGRAALRELKTLSSFLASVKLEAFGDNVMSLKIGDCFRWSWGDFRISEAVMRITKINYGGVLTNYAIIDAVEDSFSTPSEAVIPYIPPVENNHEKPKPAETFAIEAPFYDLVQNFGQATVISELDIDPTIGYVLASAKRPQQNAINATMVTSNGGDFNNVGAIDFCPTAQLVGNLDKLSQSFVVKNTDSLSLLTANTLMQINEELMAFVSYSISTQTITVKRGVFDTTVHEHDANSTIFFWDNFESYDPIQRIDGEVVEVKALTNTGFDILKEDDAPTETVELSSRAIRPYPPANIKINDEYFPNEFIDAIVLSWFDRNRLQQTGGEILGFYDGSVSIEDGVDYIVELHDSNDVVIDFQNVGQLNTATMDISGLTTQFAKVILYSSRDGVGSYQRFEHTMLFGFLPPYNLNGSWNNTDQSIDLTWEFDE